jgi:NADH:ubiquinone oxidoreductase subunit F (NADH-binding)
VYEAPYGIPLQDLLAAAGGPKGALQAVLLGGYHGAWIPASEADVAVSRAALAPLGASPGAGVVVALPTTRCGLADSAHIAAYLARQSAGQCGPCLNGLPRLADTLTRLADRRPDPGLTSEVRRLAALVTGRGACQHPDGTARFVQSALRVFGNEVRLHLAGRCTEDAERTSG